MSDLTVDDRAVVNGETVAAAFESKGGQPTMTRGPSSATSGGRMRSRGIRGAGFCRRVFSRDYLNDRPVRSMIGAMLCAAAG